MTDPSKMDASPPPAELLEAIQTEINDYLEDDVALTATEMAELVAEFIVETGNPTVVTNGESTVHTRIRRGDKLDLALYSASFETGIVSVGEQPDPEKAQQSEEPGEYFAKLYGIPVTQAKFSYVPLFVTTYSENREQAVEIHSYMQEVLSNTFEERIFEDPLDIVSRDNRETAYGTIEEALRNWYESYGTLESLDQLDDLNAQLSEVAEEVEIEVEVPPEKVSEDDEYAGASGKEQEHSQVELSEEERSALEGFASEQEVQTEEDEEQKGEMYYDYQMLRQISGDDLREFVEETGIAFVYDPLVGPGTSVDEVDEDVFVEVFGYPYRQALIPVLVATPESGEDALDRINLLYYGMMVQCKSGERLFVAE